MAAFSAYERDGIAKQVKAHIETSFKPLDTILNSFNGDTFDQNLQMMDFEKLANFESTSLCYKLLGADLSLADFSESEQIKNL
jgi:hypothetical protein